MTEDGSGSPNQPRPAKNLKGLLKFCMEATASEDASSSRESGTPMSEERKKWLEEALTSMTVSPVERMDLCIIAIEEAEIDTEAGTSQQINAITELQDWAEDLDIAIDFIKIKGLRIIPRLLSSEVSELRWRGLELLGNIAQNNPAGQAALLTSQLLPPMLFLLDSDPNPNVRVKALYAISCLVRNNSTAQNQLVSHDGLSALIKALSSEEVKMQTKSTFLISSLCASNPALKDAIVDKGVVEQIVELLQGKEHTELHEHLMSALLAIVSEHAGARQRCLREDFDLKTFLCQRIRLLENQEAYQEEKDYAEKLLLMLNAERTPSQASSMAVMAV